MWTIKRIQQLLDDGIMESAELEYKESRSLAKGEGVRKEIVKDVSAFANAEGGTLIYGIAEYQDEERKHLPERLDPIDGTQYSKEWLEQVVNTAQPRIQNITIHCIEAEPGTSKFIYVLEIPQSNIAHQATDLKYYRRFNFMAEPMRDYEIRDINNRLQHPKLEFTYRIDKDESYFLELKIRNAGRIYAKYVMCSFDFPYMLLNEGVGVDRSEEIPYLRIFRDNTVADSSRLSDGTIVSINSGPKRYVPLLPGMDIEWPVHFNDHLNDPRIRMLPIYYSLRADNSDLIEGQFTLRDAMDVKSSYYRLGNVSDIIHGRRG